MSHRGTSGSGIQNSRFGAVPGPVIGAEPDCRYLGLRVVFDDSTIMSGIRVGMLLRHEHADDVGDQAAVRR